MQVCAIAITNSVNSLSAHVCILNDQTEQLPPLLRRINGTSSGAGMFIPKPFTSHIRHLVLRLNPSVLTFVVTLAVVLFRHSSPGSNACCRIE